MTDAAGAEAGLALADLRIALDGRRLMRLDARILPGEVLTVMGPSGSGKSTLLSAIIGILPAAFALEGRVLLDGQDVTPLAPERRRIGILFQDDLLFPHLSVGANLSFGLRARRLAAGAAGAWWTGRSRTSGCRAAPPAIPPRSRAGRKRGSR